MEMLREQWLILFSTPLYIFVIGAEILFSHWRKKHLYSGKGLVVNIYFMLANMGLDLLMRTLALAVMYHFYSMGNGLAYGALGIAAYWVFLTIFEDFMFYWEHRIDHYCRVFWAVHVTHHSSEEYNLTVGFRSSVLQPLYRFIYFIPVAWVGFKPEDILFAYSYTQIWGILVHTQSIGKLWAPIEYIFVTPSHHRVHHASNIRYLDKNMGMFLIIWDRLFGTFEKEDEKYEPIKYGLTKNIETNNPITMVFHEWQAIKNDLNKSPKWKDKWMYLFGPPGWSHDGSTMTSAQLRKMEKK